MLCSGVDASVPDMPKDVMAAVSELVFSAPVDVRNAVYRDLHALRDERWTLTYEGALSQDTSSTSVDGPAVRYGQMFVDETGFRMVDQSQPFCEAGVEPYDVVQMRGCDPSVANSAQCPVGYTCFVHPNSQIQGLGACMLDDEADRLAEACKDYLTSLRRYTVMRAGSGELRLYPRKSVLTSTPVDGCVDDAQCANLAQFSLELAGSAHPANDTTAQTSRTYACRVDPERSPLDGPGQTGKRCIETCTAASPCSTGRVCRIPGGQTVGTCYEGVVPPQACVAASQRYEVRAHEAFTVIGSQSGYVHGLTRDPNSDRCIRDPDAHPFDLGRIPLSAPACDPTANLLTGQRPDGSYEPNPCSVTVDQTELAPNYVDASCAVGDPATSLVTRQAPALRFRNRGLTLTLVDPTYPGDDKCIGDRKGTLGNIPLAFPGYQLTWRQVSGFNPFGLSLSSVAFPTKVVRGPLQSIWVVDEGDVLSTTLSTPSTRGKVYRVEPETLKVNEIR